MMRLMMRMGTRMMMIFYPEYFIDRPLTALIEIMQLCHLKTETNYMEHKCILDHENDKNYDH